jgi:putative ABC transport system permease protein
MKGDAMLNRLKLRLQALFLKPKMEKELDDEVRFHLEREIEENIARGMSQEEARYAALRSFGGIDRVKEESRDERGIRLLDEVWQDLRYGVRMSMKQPGFTLIAVIALSLGIGANTAIFSVVNAVLLRPLPYQDPDRLVVLWETHPQIVLRDERSNVSPANFIDWRDQSRVFEQVAALGGQRGFNLTTGGEPERIQGARVSVSLFSLLGVQPYLGRSFLPEEDQASQSRVVLLSHGLWQRRFGSDPGIIGKTLSLNLRSYTVVGVMPREFNFPEEVEVWTPMAFSADERKTRDFHYLNVIARLKPGVTLLQAQAEMSTLASRLEQQYPGSNAKRSVQLASLHEHLVGKVKLALLVLLGAVVFVLLIACANVANMLLARAATRQREIAIRLTLGATRLRLVRQLLTESVLLALLGGAFGVLMASWGVHLLIRLSPGNLPRLTGVSIDGRVLGFTLTLSILTGLVFGLLPALQAARFSLNETLKESSRGAEGASQHRARSLLVIAEVALSLVLLLGAGLMIRSFMQLNRVSPGFKPDHLLTARLSPTTSKFRNEDEGIAFYQQVIEQVGALPGVVSAGAVTHPPMSDINLRLDFAVEGRQATAPGEKTSAEARAVSPGYFETMGIPLLKGRDFTLHDHKQSARVAIINETMARKYWPNEDPMGKRLTMEIESVPRQIIGVVGDVRHWGLDQGARAEMYWPLFQKPLVFMTLMVRTTSDPASFVAAVRREVSGIDKDQPVYSIKPMEQLISDSIAQQRLNLLLLTIFAGVALALAAIGIYGVMAYAVTQRTREIGIRIALGAQASDVFKLVIGQGIMQTLVGLTVGLVASFALTRVMKNLLFGVSTTDSRTFVFASLLLAGVALLACYLPARRAIKVDPLLTLRRE